MMTRLLVVLGVILFGVASLIGGIRCGDTIFGFVCWFMVGASGGTLFSLCRNAIKNA